MKKRLEHNSVFVMHWNLIGWAHYYSFWFLNALSWTKGTWKLACVHTVAVIKFTGATRSLNDAKEILNWKFLLTFWDDDMFGNGQ